MNINRPGMYANVCCVLLVGLLCSCRINQSNSRVSELKLKDYPKTRKDTTVEDTFFGTVVPDPYRWLENDTSQATGEWVKAQNEVTFDYLSQLPLRERIRKRLEELWNYEKYSAPFKEGGWTYFYKNDGLQNQYVLYRQKEGGEPEVFLDPNTFSKDGTTSLAGISFTRDGSLAAYLISEGGSDWRKVIVIETENKSIIEDTLVNVKFSGIAWQGNEGFYYSSYDKPSEGSPLSAMTDRCWSSLTSNTPTARRKTPGRPWPRLLPLATPWPLRLAFRVSYQTNITSAPTTCGSRVDFTQTTATN